MSADAQRIVVRSVNWLGDAVMTTSALQRLREAKPDAHITMLSHEKLADLWKHQSFVDDVIAFTSEETPLQIGRRLRWGNFETGLIFPNSPRSGLEMWFGKIPERIGYSRPWRNLFLTRKIPARRGEIKMRKRSVAEIKRRISSATAREQFPASAHHIHQYLHLVSETFGANRQPLAPKISVLDSEVAAFQKRFQISGNSSPIFGLNPGAEYGGAKRWPRERFISVAIDLQKRMSCRWFIFGGKADVDLAADIEKRIVEAAPGSEIVDLAGRTSLRELCSAFKLCSFVLTNDTGPMHLAAAVGTPVIVPFGSTSAELTGPDLVQADRHKLISADAPCAPCFLRECPIDFRCMKDIGIEEIVRAAMVLLAKK